ncbi:hypothetical protein ACMD2_06425 [Ananas comosus]|uniref:Uncharacterized protein n=1 Tax=Ananas comosus TaxID=4615 RepID=A0A199VEA5_ANACO|nr:hypothetical protein ACMD2_06425 [Ananas comosus]
MELPCNPTMQHVRDEIKCNLRHRKEFESYKDLDLLENWIKWSILLFAVERVKSTSADPKLVEMLALLSGSGLAAPNQESSSCSKLSVNDVSMPSFVTPRRKRMWDGVGPRPLLAFMSITSPKRPPSQLILLSQLLPHSNTSLSPSSASSSASSYLPTFRYTCASTKCGSPTNGSPSTASPPSPNPLLYVLRRRTLPPNSGAVVEHGRNHQFDLLISFGLCVSAVTAPPFADINLFFPSYKIVKRGHPRYRVHPKPGLPAPGPQRGRVVAGEFEPAVLVAEQLVLVVDVLVAEVGDGHQQKSGHHSPGDRHGLPRLDVVGELGVGIVEEEVVVDERVARDDAEEVDEALGCGADERGDAGAAGAGVEDGEVDVGVGVGGVVEAAAGDGVGGAPEREDAVHADEVGEEGAVLVVALPGPRRPEHGHQRGERRVHELELAPQEGARRGEDRGEVPLTGGWGGGGGD